MGLRQKRQALGFAINDVKNEVKAAGPSAVRAFEKFARALDDCLKEIEGDLADLEAKK